MIIDFYGRFAFDFLLAYHWVGLKPFGHPVVEFFDKRIGFSWRSYRDLSSGFTYVDLVMGPFMATVMTTAPLTTFDEREITYMAATIAGWLPYLVDVGIRYVHYFANRVRKQFGLDQDIPDDFTAILESTTSVRLFLRPGAFEFWSRHFTTSNHYSKFLEKRA